MEEGKQNRRVVAEKEIRKRKEGGKEDKGRKNERVGKRKDEGGKKKGMQR